MASGKNPGHKPEGVAPGLPNPVADPGSDCAPFPCARLVIGLGFGRTPAQRTSSPFTPGGGEIKTARTASAITKSPPAHSFESTTRPPIFAKL